MTSSASGTDYIVEKLTDLDYVMRDDIHVSSDDTVTTYIPSDRLEDVQNLEDLTVEVLEEHDYEYLISAKASQ
jgi:hypothetical protein